MRPPFSTDASLRRGPRKGFTLAEVAVALVIVAMASTLVLQGITTAKFNAAQTHNRKVARELALLTLGRLQAGLYWEDLDQDEESLRHNYAEDGYEDWSWEIWLGEDNRPAEDGSYGGYDEDTGYWDNWAHERELELERQRENDEDEEDQAPEPYEHVYITVTYPRLGDQPNTLMLERWIPWELVYGEDPDAVAAEGEEGLPVDER